MCYREEFDIRKTYHMDKIRLEFATFKEFEQLCCSLWP